MIYLLQQLTYMTLKVSFGVYVILGNKSCYCRGTVWRACQQKSCNYETSHL